MEESTGAVESTGSIKLENENVPSILASKMAEEFAKADIVFYDGRKSKSKASDVRKWFKLHYGIELPGTDAVGTYDKTFATSR